MPSRPAMPLQTMAARVPVEPPSDRDLYLRGLNDQQEQGAAGSPRALSFLSSQKADLDVYAPQPPSPPAVMHDPAVPLQILAGPGSGSSTLPNHYISPHQRELNPSSPSFSLTALDPRQDPRNRFPDRPPHQHRTLPTSRRRLGHVHQQGCQGDARSTGRVLGE